MRPNIFSCPLLFFVIVFFISISFSVPMRGVSDQFLSCNTSFDCGKLKEIRYTFLGNGRPDYCGHPELNLDCEEEKAIIEIMSQKYKVINISTESPILKIARLDLWENICPDRSLDSTPFRYTPSDKNSTLLYNCSSYESADLPKFSCTHDKVPLDAYLVINTNLANNFSAICQDSVVVPVLRMPVRGPMNPFPNIGAIRAILNEGFEVKLVVDEAQCTECMTSGGSCGYNFNLDEPCCYCTDQPCAKSCPPPPSGTLPAASGTPPAASGTPPAASGSPPAPSGKKTNLGLKLGIGFGAAGGSILLMSLLFLIYLRRKRKLYIGPSLISRNISSHPSSMTDLERAGSVLGVHIFTFSELEEATNYFDSKKELGDGGFGTVYQGKLRDGRVVAVKRLYENNYRRVEQFMNEVEILTRLRHQNLVSLYGCTSRHCRELVLVYEYIPNGTVADHLHGEQAEPGSLTWSTRMSIAIETASALAFLHASDVIHRDVKTNNILLDNNFCVKVADFGLSRLFPNHVTHISTAPQGTPGYVDPEYHECYQLTVKSDVFSFGVVLIELISSKPAVDITRHRHEINLSNMAINKIQSHALHELVDPCLGFESDYKVRGMITDVAELAFQCLQNAREMRPSMEEVLQALKGVQSKDYRAEKPEEIGIPTDDNVLLKNKPCTLSPDSVTDKWLVSSSTTPNASG